VNFFNKIKSSLSKTKNQVFNQLAGIISSKRKIDDDLLDEIEEILITGDVGVQTSISIIEALKTKVRKSGAENTDVLFTMLKEEIVNIFNSIESEAEVETAKPRVVLVVGVNGVGKTTSIGKITKIYKEQGLDVLLGAADTFRAAAIEQLTIWAERNEVEIVSHKEGSDPSAVAFDSVAAGIARKKDIVLIDTAGRLHNKKHLMDELAKIKRVIQKQIPEAPHEVMLVLDATMGQNAVQQAKSFKELIHVDSIILTKLDGTAKGGVILSIYKELGIPVRYVGVGEGIDDLNLFEPKAFVEGIFD
jgi:fused signal recognition particle receptor